MIGNRPDRPRGGHFRPPPPELPQLPLKTRAKRLFWLVRLTKDNFAKAFRLDAVPAYVRKLVDEPCVYCGGQAGTRDHLRPFSEGGRSDWHNLAPACAGCNSERGSQPPLLYLLRKRAETPAEKSARKRRNFEPKKPPVIPKFTWDYAWKVKWDDRQR